MYIFHFLFLLPPIMRCWNCHYDLYKRNKYNILDIFNFSITIDDEDKHINKVDNMVNINFNGTEEKNINIPKKILRNQARWLCIPLFLTNTSRQHLRKLKNNLFIAKKKKLKTCISEILPKSLIFERGIGMFCSFPCAWAYIEDRRPFCTCPSITKEAIRCLALLIQHSFRLRYIHKNIYIPPILKIYPKSAKHYSSLRDYGGELTRTSYNFHTYEVMKECLNLYWNKHCPEDLFKKKEYNNNHHHQNKDHSMIMHINNMKRNPLPILKEIPSKKKTENFHNSNVLEISNNIYWKKSESSHNSRRTRFCKINSFF